MKKTILSLLIGLSLSSYASASADLSALSQELEIMKGILKTSLRKPVNSSHISIRDVDATYLSGQGVVFELQTSNMDWSYEFHVFSGDSAAVAAPKPPKPPEPHVKIVTSNGAWEMDFDVEGWHEMAEDAMREAQDALRQVKSKLRNLNETQHELAWEIRDLERRKRELGFAKRTADGERLKDIEEDLQEIEDELAQLNSRQTEVANYAEQIRQEQEQKEAQKKQAKEKQYKLFLAQFESEIGDVFCRYGAGLKGLPKQEHISLVLPKFDSNHHGNAKKDRIYVFKAEDVQACVRDKIDKENLLTRAKSYLF